MVLRLPIAEWKEEALFVQESVYAGFSCLLLEPIKQRNLLLVHYLATGLDMVKLDILPVWF